MTDRDPYAGEPTTVPCHTDYGDVGWALWGFVLLLVSPAAGIYTGLYLHSHGHVGGVAATLIGMAACAVAFYVLRVVGGVIAEAL